MAVLLLHFIVSFSSKTTDISTDRSTLLALKAHVVSDPRNFLTTNWSVDISICNWVGVTCESRNQRVIALNLFNMSLSGTIPPDMGNLSFLTWLNIGYNNFHDLLPVQLTNLYRLKFISMSDNNFHGEISSWVGYFPELQYLSLSNNSFTGPIPSDMCDRLPTLKELNLSDNKLSGKIPIGLFKCKGLQNISLDFNSLEGILPEEIGNLTMLRTLDLRGNQIQGVIPQQISNLTGPRVLYLSHNFFTGHIPVTLGNLRDLELLDLSNNDLSGTLSSSERSFLSSLANCSRLTALAFGSNPLISGYLPPSIANLSVSLQYFDASSCSISGSIPGEIGNGNVATYLDFSGNHFSGAISDRVCNRNNDLRYLAVNDNQLEGKLPLYLTNCSELVFLNVADNNLSDTFPHWLGTLPQLRVLILRSNRFYGSIQSYIATSSFSKLQIIDLSHNEFTGLLPTNFFQNLKALKEAEYVDNGNWFSLVVNLTIKGLELEFTLKVRMPLLTCIDLSMNGFHGEIPKVVGELRLLQALNLSHNSLTGPIPPSFGNLAALESFDLSFNKLSGRIPSQLTNLTFLQVLRFWNNNLVGPIPHGKQFDTFENDSYRGNLDLCGFPLSKECNNDEIPERAQDEEDNGNDNGNGNGIAFIWKVAMMGYGSGMVLGISIGYIVFTTGRPRWLVRKIERDLQNKVSG
ncbi:receptor-like protein 9DC3 [Gossypium arboreum]|uniref:receptor-like protein 9DC3 n=1 Tax=Gossypium arboreum TaxID=29729 RepID=UPI000818FFE1|nr:receptor-like protein 9DC3 [Gossypium arboreum]